jgi:heme A synthase
VIIWGAVVRATGSGRGCGSHWPTCNGDIVPLDGTAATMIEFTHRLTSAALGLLILYLVYRAWRSFPPGSRVRLAAASSLVLVVVESGIGAGLVVLEQTGEYAGVSRAAWQGGHFANTLLLLAAITLTAWWGWRPGGERPLLVAPGTRSDGRWLGAAAGFLLVIGTSGAIAALGDTLFPVESFGEGLERELSATAHLFERLRVVHPILAIGLGLAVAAIANRVAQAEAIRLGVFGRLIWLVVVFQLILGGINVALAAPVWMQLVHLVVADLLWILLVLLASERLVRSEELVPA